MDNGSSIIPIIVGIIVFIIKIVSDANKKQTQTRKTSGSVQRSPGRPVQKTDVKSSGNNWEKSRIKENEYRSLDPNFVPKSIPDVDYDKLTNVSVQSSQEDTKPEPIATIKKTDNSKLISIRKKLKEPGTVKELYLLSVIFNKPKAHLTWQRSTH